jgi:hypothetical protein
MATFFEKNIQFPSLNNTTDCDGAIVIASSKYSTGT